MPFDCAPIIENKRATIGEAALVSGRAFGNTEPIKVRPMRSSPSKRGGNGVNSIVAVLVRARALIEDERRWCQGSFARCYRFAVPFSSMFARRFCAIGAVMRASRQLMLRAEDACMALQSGIGRAVEDWNDDPKRTHAEVLALFDATILGLRQAT